MDNQIRLDGDWLVHSTFSDGSASAAEIVDAADAHRLNTVCVADHVRCSTGWVRDLAEACRAADRKAMVKVHCAVEADLLDTAGTVDVPRSTGLADFIFVSARQLPTHTARCSRRRREGESPPAACFRQGPSSGWCELQPAPRSATATWFSPTPSAFCPSLGWTSAICIRPLLSGAGWLREQTMIAFRRRRIGLALTAVAVLALIALTTAPAQARSRLSTVTRARTSYRSCRQHCFPRVTQHGEAGGPWAVASGYYKSSP